MKPTFRFLSAFLLIVLPALHVQGSPDFYVALTGNDSNAGTRTAPFATIQRARDAIRELRAAGQLPKDRPLQVVIADGRYTIKEPFELLPEDSGSATAPIEYVAAANAKPVFSGGRRIGGWKAGADGVWTTTIPEVATGKWYFEQLWINGRRAVRARSPNKFFYHIQDVREETLAPGSPRKSQQTLRMRSDDFAASLGTLKAEEIRNVNLVVYHNWDNTRRFLDTVDSARSLLISSGEKMKPWNPWRRNNHFFLENFRVALDAPGEWFLSRDGVLSYKPHPGEDMTHAEVIAPMAEKLLVLAGDSQRGRFIEHVHFRGLRFEHCQWLASPTGFEPKQAAASIEAAVLADGTRHVVIEDCEVGHVGLYAIWFRTGCRDCVIKRCHVFDLGAGGIRIGQEGIAKLETERTSHITLDNNIIRHGGRIFPCAVGVWIGQSGDNRVTHNEIADFFYSGISVGWRWGYGESLAKRNTIEFNRVHHIGWGLLSDMGGIYTLGPSEGTVVRNNVFHDIYAYSYGGWGLYTDEGSSGILFENNLVHNVKTGGFHQHYGRENVLRNNILAYSKLFQLQASRVEDHLSFTLEKNIIYFDTGETLSGAWDKVRHESRNNCYWNATGKPVKFLGNDLAAWQAKGHEIGSLFADPKFANPNQRDFRIAADSPALQLGFQPFDATQAGVYGEAAWIAKANSVTYPPLEIIPEAPPISIDDDFEDPKENAAPRGTELHVENNGDAIIVTSEAAASGKQSVKFIDAPNLKHDFYPHLVYNQLSHAEGTVKNSFDLRFEAPTNLRMEWREYNAGQYFTGPTFTIRDGKLLVGKQMAALPLDTWMHIEIETTLGRSGPSWTLRVTPAGQATQTFANLSSEHPEFRRLTWIGIMSNANVKTAFYMDNMRLAGAEK